jgi:hypothetical protein
VFAVEGSALHIADSVLYGNGAHDGGVIDLSIASQLSVSRSRMDRNYGRAVVVVGIVVVVAVAVVVAIVYYYL